VPTQRIDVGLRHGCDGGASIDGRGQADHLRTAGQGRIRPNGCALPAGGLDVGAEMVRIGLAVVIGGGTSLYGSLEAQSRAFKTGVWASEFEMPGAYREARPRDPLNEPRTARPAVDRLRTTTERRQVGQPRTTGSAF
jgi:hypothetical protein